MIKPFRLPCVGYDLAADWYQGATTDTIILLLYGFRSSKAGQSGLTTELVETTGSSALVFDYSGHGDSPFTLEDIRPAQHFLEVITAFDWITAHHPQARIWVVGNSYGSFMATELTKYRDFDKLVLRAPAIYKPEEFYTPFAVRLNDEASYQNEMQRYRNDAEALSQHPLLARASRYAGKPLVVIHEHDELIPRTTSDAFIKAFSAESFVAEGFSHSIGRDIQEGKVSDEQLTAYQDGIAHWLMRPAA